MKTRKLFGVIALLGLAGTTYAAGAGNTVVNAGWLHLDPGYSSDPLQVDAMGQTQTLAGTNTTIKNVDTAAITIGYFFTDHFMAETALGLPPTVHLYGAGTLSSAGELGNAKIVTPSVLGKYYFGEKDAVVRPFVGLGLSYVSFTDIKLQPSVSSGAFLASPSTGTALEGPTTAVIKSSFAPLLNAGLMYRFHKDWSAGISFTYAPVHSKAILTTQSSVGTVTTTEKFTMNSVNTLLSVGYTF